MRCLWLSIVAFILTLNLNAEATNKENENDGIFRTIRDVDRVNFEDTDLHDRVARSPRRQNLPPRPGSIANNRFMAKHVVWEGEISAINRQSGRRRENALSNFATQKARRAYANSHRDGTVTIDLPPAGTFSMIVMNRNRMNNLKSDYAALGEDNRNRGFLTNSEFKVMQFSVDHETKQLSYEGEETAQVRLATDEEGAIYHYAGAVKCPGRRRISKRSPFTHNGRSCRYIYRNSSPNPNANSNRRGQSETSASNTGTGSSSGSSTRRVCPTGYRRTARGRCQRIRRRNK